MAAWPPCIWPRTSRTAAGWRSRSDLATARLTVAASTRLVANVLLQYNALKLDLGANLRIGYTFRPGSDLFLVFNERRATLPGFGHRASEPGW